MFYVDYMLKWEYFAYCFRAPQHHPHVRWFARRTQRIFVLRAKSYYSEEMQGGISQEKSLSLSSPSPGFLMLPPSCREQWARSFPQQKMQECVQGFWSPVEIQRPSFVWGLVTWAFSALHVAKYSTHRRKAGIWQSDIVNTHSWHCDPPHQSGSEGKPGSQMPAAGQPCTQTLLKVAASVLL